MKKKAVIYDLDGVLTDTETYYRQQLIDELDKLGCDYTSDFLDGLVGIADPEAAVEFDKLGIDGNKLIADVNEINKNGGMDYPSLLFPDAIDSLTHFKSRGYLLALASSSPRHLIDDFISQCDLEKFFDSICSGHEFSRSKPEPDIYLETLRKLKVEAEDAVVIEDSTYGIEAAKAAGIYTIAIRDKHYGTDQSEADVIVDSLNEVGKIVSEIESGD